MKYLPRTAIEPAHDSEAGRCSKIHRKTDGHYRRGERKLLGIPDRNEWRVVVDFEKGNAASGIGREELCGDTPISMDDENFLRISDNVIERIDCTGRVSKKSGGAQLSMTVVGLYTNR